MKLRFHAADHGKNSQAGRQQACNTGINVLIILTMKGPISCVQWLAETPAPAHLTSWAAPGGNVIKMECKYLLDLLNKEEHAELLFFSACFIYLQMLMSFAKLQS